MDGADRPAGLSAHEGPDSPNRRRVHSGGTSGSDPGQETPLQAFAARGLTRFVGRAPELEVLHQASARARAGHGQVVALVGDPSMDKSRLFYEFLHSV